MGPENKSTMKTDDRATSPKNDSGLQTQNPDLNKNVLKADKTTQGSGMYPHKPAEQERGPDEGNQSDSDGNRDVSGDRHPEELKFNDKSGRV
jgi:hypothetical protein